MRLALGKLPRPVLSEINMLRSFKTKINLLSQKAKMQWIKGGDQNSSFFHRSVKIRCHKIKVNAIKDLSGNIFSDQLDNENCFINFYKDLWSSSSSFNLDSLLNAMLNDFPTLSIENGFDLVKPISLREVYHSLASMPRGKSPGPDGLNVEFYLFYWNIIGDHFFKAISYFFEHSKIPHSWGRTFIALIPKKR